MQATLIPPITPDTILDEMMAAYKATIPLFIHRKMLCIGCPVARLHDVREACQEHGIPLQEFLDELNAAALGTAA